MSSPIRKISSVKVSGDKYTYTGKVCIPEVTVKNSVGTILENGQDFDVIISDYAGRTVNQPVKVGAYKLTVIFKGSYEGTSKAEYTVKPKGTSVKRLVAGKKQLTVKWSKKTAQVTGYQIRYSNKSSMKNAKSVLVTKVAATKITIKKLKSKTKYYVQIRTYKTVNGQKYYSDWSSKKSIKIK
jgi:hypothetical protein